ncbi:MAG: DedA family protein [Candidatus Spechtbacteria bacterium]|nr:DedA family protein [Candidatus Spechtbacteria bacterium]
MEVIIERITFLIVSFIQQTGYTGIGILMTLESANIPVPSEIVMPFSGFLAWRGEFTFWGVVLVASFGNLLGSWISYEIASRGGSVSLAKYGKYLLITKDDLECSRTLFNRFGSGIILVGRVLPIVRTFISFAAGIGHMNRAKFLLYTFIGSIPWNIALVYTGFVAGEKWSILEPYFRAFDWLIVLLIIVGTMWWVWYHFKHIKIIDV